MTELLLFLTSFLNDVNFEKLPEKICVQEKISWRYTNWDSIIRWNKYKAKTIYICKKDKETMKNTLVHELWHYVWYNKLSEAEKGYWIELNQKSETVYDYWREYWMKNYEEDFATLFEYLYNWGNEEFASPILIQKILFIKKIIWNKKYI